MFLGEFGKHLRVTQSKEFELNLQELGLGIANLFEDVTGDRLIAFVRVQDMLDTIAQGSCVAAGGKASQGEEDLRLAIEVGVEGTAAAASLGGDVLNPRRLKPSAARNSSDRVRSDLSACCERDTRSGSKLWDRSRREVFVARDIF
jgi:hypothetical protein